MRFRHEYAAHGLWMVEKIRCCGLRRISKLVQSDFCFEPCQSRHLEFFAVSLRDGGLGFSIENESASILRKEEGFDWPFYLFLDFRSAIVPTFLNHLNI